MKTKKFLASVEQEKIHQAIQKADAGTTGDMVLYICHKKTKEALRTAEKRFEEIGLHRSPQKNGLLIFVAPESRQFALVGGSALNAKLGPKNWQKLIDLLALHFKEERYTEGLLAVITEAGKVMKKHFPGKTRQRKKDIQEK